MKKNFAKIYKIFLDSFYPPRCVISGEEGVWLAERFHKFPIAPANQIDFKYIDEIYAFTAYKNPIVKKIIYAFKFSGYREVGKIFAKILAEKYKNIFTEEAVLVPVPIHWRRKIWRGFNQAEYLSHEIAHLTGTKIDMILKRKYHRKIQSHLTKNERQKNVDGVFIIPKNKIFPKKVILIDDVVASGATLESAAKTLKQWGVKKVIALVVSRGGGND